MAKVIMIQGTMSNSGKSFITAGLLRCMYEDGYKVAPFKSQNMSLNSYITHENLEIGRAQAMQAEACHIKPSYRMNPILIKPTSDVGSQIILNGKVYKNMNAMEYYKNKKDFVPHVMNAYKSLADEYEVIVIEGAGSPAEINLKENDIVNMGLAKMVDSDVLLVGDIDRGGVFASLYGTVKLLDEDEQERIKGLIVNKFRGDRTILEPGLKMLEDRTGIKVVGTLPMIDIDIDDEDSLSSRLISNGIRKEVDVVVIRLPHISNFTDFNVFERIEGVSLRYVSRKSEIGNPDILIIPGTKNTIGDLMFLRENGIDTVISNLANEGKLIVGICGGFQMLGRTLVDKYAVENKGGEVVEGLSLLNLNTEFLRDKKTTNSSGSLTASNKYFSSVSNRRLSGYEIHMGVTTSESEIPFIKLDDGRYDGFINEEGNVFGTYFHGIFDNDDFTNSIIKYFCDLKGIDLEELDNEGYKEAEYDKLSKMIRENMDLDYIYKLIGLKENN